MRHGKRREMANRSVSLRLDQVIKHGPRAGEAVGADDRLGISEENIRRGLRGGAGQPVADAPMAGPLRFSAHLHFHDESCAAVGFEIRIHQYYLLCGERSSATDCRSNRSSMTIGGNRMGE